MNEVLPRLYIGDVYASANFFNMNSKNITHVLTVTNAIKPMYPGDFEYWVLPIDDTVDSDLLSHIPKGVKFIEKGLK